MLTQNVSFPEIVAVSAASLSQQVLTFTGSKRKCHHLGMRDLGPPILNFAFYLFHTLSVAVLEKVKFILWLTGVRYGGWSLNGFGNINVNENILFNFRCLKKRKHHYEKWNFTFEFLWKRDHCTLIYNSFISKRRGSFILF